MQNIKANMEQQGGAEGDDSNWPKSFRHGREPGL